MTHNTIKPPEPETPTDEVGPLDGAAPPDSSEAADRRIWHPPAGRRGWWVIAAGVATTAVALLVFGNGADPTPADPTEAQVNTAEVVRTELVEESTFDGVLGSVTGDPVTADISGVITHAAEEGSTVSQGEVLYQTDGEAVMLLYGTTPAYRDLTLGSDILTIGGSPGVLTAIDAPGAIIEQGDILFWIDGEPVIALYGDVPAYRTMSSSTDGADVAQLEQALVDLGHDPDSNLDVDGEWTSLTSQLVEDLQEAVGAEPDRVIGLGEVVFLPGPAQVVEVLVQPGETIGQGVPVLAVSTGDPMSGADVLQLEQGLQAIGFDADGTMVVDGRFTTGTAEALRAFQAANGQDADGVAHLGELKFLPGPVRIAERLASPGAQVNAGAPVLAVSSSEQVVRVDLPAADQGLVEPGDAVTVVLPDFTEVAGVVAGVASSATVGPDGEALFEVIVEISDPTGVEGLDEAPVSVNVVSDSVSDVLAVPVTALVALAEGGYAVEVDTGSGRHLVAVDPGFFAGGLVEITSGSLSEGDLVVLP